MNKNDYVLATKYRDGDPGDQWCVGFYDREETGRHYVADGNGKQFRENGFRRVAKINAERGNFMLKHSKEIYIGIRSLWWWKRRKINR